MCVCVCVCVIVCVCVCVVVVAVLFAVGGCVGVSAGLALAECTVGIGHSAACRSVSLDTVHQ